MSQETLDRRSDSLESRTRRPAKRWCLVRIWSRRQAHGVGEIAWLDGPRVLGRTGGPRPLEWIAQRPRGDRAGHPIRSTYISREQLRLRAMGPASIEVDNVGRLAMRVNGRPMRSGQVVEGDRIELDGELVLLVQRRGSMPGDSEHPFGTPCADGLVGEGPAIAALRSTLRRIAPLDGHVRITGPSGSGKEAAARALHRLSGRVGAFVPCNAAAIPESLAAAEWFGNVRNYPNPSTPARDGLAARAHRGTLLVDEIGELSPGVQAQLLRLLDSGELQRLGASATIHVDLRVIAASHRPLDALAHDLAARFPHHIAVPGLDARPEDLAVLVPHVLRQPGFERFWRDRVPRVTPRLWERLLTHPWTGHVRELTQLLWDAAARADDRDWLDADGPNAIRAPEREPTPLDAETIQAALDAHAGVKTRAAAALGLRNRHQLRRLMQKLGMI